MQHNIYLSIVLQLLNVFIIINAFRKEGQQRSYQIDENIIMKRCNLKFCTNANRECSFSKCLEHMLQLEKFGSCPKSPQSSISHMCMDTCNGQDYKCPGTTKCCRHSCGQTCQKSEGLALISDSILPEIPENVTVRNLEGYRKTAELTWHMYYRPKNKLFYITEARMHAGYLYQEHKLSNWFNVRHEVTSSSLYPNKYHQVSTKFDANVKLRLGRWYQFRMATVNENGTRGYSNYSQPFQLKRPPNNPSAPRNFTIDIAPKLLPNNTIYVQTSWKPPKTDYPIEKYKITWSLYVDLYGSNGTNGSLWLNEAYVQEPTRHFEFWNLKPDAKYYFQLQALSIFGRKRLKSPKETLYISTTISQNSSNNLQNIAPSKVINNRFRKLIFSGRQSSNISVRFVGIRKLIVRLSWPDQFNGGILDLCSGDFECFGKPSNSYNSRVHLSKTFRLEKNHFNLPDLKYATKYTVKIRNLEKNQTIQRSFVTPTCHNLSKKRPHLKCLQ